MCDAHLTCPVCGAALAAQLEWAGDNATGFYVEFFLVPFTSAGSAFVASSRADESGSTAEDRGGVSHPDAFVDITAPVVSVPGERGFDDDEAPTP